MDTTGEWIFGILFSKQKHAHYYVRYVTYDTSTEVLSIIRG